MSASSMPLRRRPDPNDPLVIVVTPDGEARAGERPVQVPAGTDPRVAVAEFVSALARRERRDISAMLVDTGRDESRRMIFRADGVILQSTRPMQRLGGAEQSDARTGRTGTRTEQAATPMENAGHRAPDAAVLAGGIPDQTKDLADGLGEDTNSERIPSERIHGIRAGAVPAWAPDSDDDVAFMMAPGPPLDVDPESVPAWPHFDITLQSDIHVVVNGVRHVVPRAASDPRAYAVAVAAAQLRRIGLARPVRTTARDPDGIVWPILIHPSGAATEAGPPETPGKKSRRGWHRAGDR